MQIERLTLRNFRNVGDEPATYLFNPRFTVVIGVNGKGKSTVLQGLNIACGTFFLGIPEAKKRHIYYRDIRHESTGNQLLYKIPVLVEAEGTFEPEECIKWRRQMEKLGSSTTSRDADVGPLKRKGVEKYHQVTELKNDKTSLPVIAFFGTRRLHGAGRNTNRPRIGRRIFTDGYKDWYDMKSSTFGYEDWLTSYDALVTTGMEYPNTRAAFITALRDANPNITRLDIFNGKLWLQAKIDGFETDYLPLELQSDGIIVHTEMVAELAYRCIVLNGYRDNEAITASSGVVMIDELDLHLHPTWQRHIVHDLKAAFPNIQFIVTTHSPFIVQSLESDEIWNLDKETGSGVDPNDLNLNNVATEIMNVPSPFSIEQDEAYKQSKDFLTALDTDASEVSLEEKLSQVEDPAVRAFLELGKMAKGK